MTESPSRLTEQSEENTLAELLIPITPENWLALQLEVEVVRDKNAAVSMLHKVVSPEGHIRPLVVIPDDIFPQTKRLLEVFEETSKAWQHMVMMVYYNGNEWAYKVNYKY